MGEGERDFTKESKGLIMENNDLRQEFVGLRDTVQHLQDEMDSLAGRLREEERERKEKMHQIEDQFQQQLENLRMRCDCKNERYCKCLYHK